MDIAVAFPKSISMQLNRHLNNINQYVAILSFQNKEDLNLIWEIYYSEVRKQMIDSIINDYMKK